MNKSTRALTVTLLLASGALPAVHAEKRVEVKAPDGNVEVAALTTGTKITFGEGGVSILNDGQPTVSVGYPQAQSIVFANYSGVLSLAGQSSLGLLRNPVGDLLEVKGHDNSPATLGISSIGGGRMLSLKEWKGEAIDVSSLAPGIYLLTINNNTLKFIKK